MSTTTVATVGCRPQWLAYSALSLEGDDPIHPVPNQGQIIRQEQYNILNVRFKYQPISLVVIGEINYILHTGARTPRRVQGYG